MRWHEELENLGPEVRKTYQARIKSGFFDRYLSGEHILDIGYKGGNPLAVPIVPHAIGVDRDYPGYDGIRLPFDDESQDTVHSSHCLEHIEDYQGALAEWFRVLKIGGYLIVCVPHRWLYERKPAPTSRFGGNEHLRFYTVGSLAAEVEASLPAGAYRIRILRDNDDGFDYSVPADQPPQGCYEVELVLQKIVPPTYAEVLELSPRAKAIVMTYRSLIQTLLLGDAASAGLDTETLAAFGRALPIPPFAIVRQMFPDINELRLRDTLWPLVDPTIVDPEWYIPAHPDVRGPVARGELTDIGDHYRRAGYFERKLPRRVDPVYG